MSLIATAGLAGVVAPARFAVLTTCSTVPQARHSPHLPTQRGLLHPHSTQENPAAARFVDVLMTGTLTPPTDNAPSRGLPAVGVWG